VPWKSIPGVAAAVAVLAVALAAYLKFSWRPSLPPMGVSPSGFMELAVVALLFGINWSLARGPSRE
jgi:hypothetical protein